MNNVHDMKLCFNKNKRTAVGDIINCPVCNTVMMKRYNKHQFCSTKGAGNCMDMYYSKINGVTHETT